jgi:hypothetical protein
MRRWDGGVCVNKSCENTLRRGEYELEESFLPGWTVNSELLIILMGLRSTNTSLVTNFYFLVSSFTGRTPRSISP